MNAVENSPTSDQVLLQAARRTFEIEAAAVEALRARLDGTFARACRLCLQCNGRIVVSGMGKSGHVGRKLAATLASTGTPSHFVHPAEASHGDLGMILPQDVVLALSYSGETDELLFIYLSGARGINLDFIEGPNFAGYAGNALEAEVLVFEIAKGLGKQPRGGKQHQGKRRLENHQRFARQ